MLALAVAAVAAAQNLASPAESGQAIRVIGVVQAIDAGARRMSIRTDAGSEALLRYDETTVFQRVAPGQKDLRNATPISVTELAAGDRVLARVAGAGSPASSIIVMAKADLARKQAAERAEWEKRGTGGLVTAVNLEAKEITVSVPGFAGARGLVIALAEGAQLRRYAPDSVKFSDAQPSRLEEIRVGDQVRALGSRSADAARFTAEQLVSGSFLNVVGTVEAVSPRDNTLRVKELATRKEWLVVVNPDSNLRRVPPFDGERPGMRPGGSTGAGAALGSRPRDLQLLLERMPAITLPDLKPGDTIAVASTCGTDASRMTAITILAGVERLLAARSQRGQQASLGSWNLDLNMNMAGP
jgi:hypothetical protein